MGKNKNKHYTPVNTGTKAQKAGVTVKVVTKTTPTYVREKDKIESFKDLKHAGIILMDNEIMQKIRTQSGPLAPSCEYQVHYWSLVIRAAAPDGSILDICIPTTFFNYKQEVSGARIDFELSDVDETSEQLAPVHNMKVNELVATGIVEQITALLPADRTISLLSTNLNSIHKHPGEHTHQSFSGTDLTTSHTTNTGIVFPLAEGNLKPNFAGIMAHDGAKNKVAHFEYRIANGKVGPLEADTIKYYRGRCICIVKSDLTPAKPAVPPSVTEAMFGIAGIEAKEAIDNSYLTCNELKKVDVENMDLVTGITSMWKENEFAPFTETIIPDNIARKVSAVVQHNPYAYGFNKGKTAHSTPAKSTSPTSQANMYNNLYGWEDAFDDEYATMHGGMDTEQSDTPSTKKDDDIDYMKEISKLTWYTEKQLTEVTDKDLDEKTRVLEALYFGSDVTPAGPELDERKALIDDL